MAKKNPIVAIFARRKCALFLLIVCLAQFLEIIYLLRKLDNISIMMSSIGFHQVEETPFPCMSILEEGHSSLFLKFKEDNYCSWRTDGDYRVKLTRSHDPYHFNESHMQSEEDVIRCHDVIHDESPVGRFALCKINEDGRITLPEGLHIDDEHETIADDVMKCYDSCPKDRGYCFMGKCFCKAGFFGYKCSFSHSQFYYTKCANYPSGEKYDDSIYAKECNEELFKHKGGFGWASANIHDLQKGHICRFACLRGEGGILEPVRFIDPQTGKLQLDPSKTWGTGMKKEKAIWAGSSYTTGDRADYHKKFFKNYNHVPLDLGDVMEVGCGPFTQTQFIMKSNNQRTANSFVFSDPFADFYIDRVPACPYRDRANFTVLGKKYRIRDVISVPAEELTPEKLGMQFDTIVMINVLEHVMDPLAILTNIYENLKDDGWAIIGERIFPVAERSLEWNSMMNHPIRIKQNIFNHFQNFFETEFYFVEHAQNYFIGRKRPREKMKIVNFEYKDA